MNKVLILDTSILCVWLKIPGKDSCGVDDDRWDYARVERKIEQEKGSKTTFVLPLASIIETGNHIAQAKNRRRELATALAQIMKDSANEKTPWAAYSQQSVLWNQSSLNVLADTWPELATQKLSLGDATIKDVAKFYAETGCQVEILTGDQGLKAYEPLPNVPRRRKR